MVLPGVALFPDGILPLRIFEPRYRAMLEFALEHDRMFCVAQMKPGLSEAEKTDDFFHTAGIGLVSASVTQQDGTSNLMLRGLARVRFTGFLQDTPFRIAEVSVLKSVGGDSPDANELAGELRTLCEGIRLRESALPASFIDELERAEDPDVITNKVAHALVSDSLARQGLLSEQNVAVRLRTLIRILRAEFPSD